MAMPLLNRRWEHTPTDTGARHRHKGRGTHSSREEAIIETHPTDVLILDF